MACWCTQAVRLCKEPPRHHPTMGGSNCTNQRYYGLSVTALFGAFPGESIVPRRSCSPPSPNTRRPVAERPGRGRKQPASRQGGAGGTHVRLACSASGFAVEVRQTAHREPGVLHGGGVLSELLAAIEDALTAGGRPARVVTGGTRSACLWVRMIASLTKCRQPVEKREYSARCLAAARHSRFSIG